MPDYKPRGMGYLRRKLDEKRRRVLLRYRYFEAKERVQDLSGVIPRRIFNDYSLVLGWCATSVDALANRLSFRTWKNDNYNINQIYAMNNPDVLFRSAIRSALIASCSFVYISPAEDGFPRLQVIDGANATGILDDTTGLLREGYAVLQRDKYERPVVEAYFLAGRTWIYQDRQSRLYENPAPYPLLVPVLYKPDASRPFGHSRISRACMGLVQGALRSIMRSEVSGEFYSYPQRYVLGLAEDAEFDSTKATISNFLAFSKDESGDSPTVGQFAQQSMQPYTDQVRMFASLFAGETGLTLDDLGFPSDNPSSVEAIRAAHENLQLTASDAQKTIGSGLLNAGYLAACVRDNFPYRRNQLYLTRASWGPVFNPDAAAIASIGDAVTKINMAVPGYFGPGNLQDLLGIAPESEEAVTNG